MKNYITLFFLSISLCFGLTAANFYVLGIVGSGSEFLLITEHTICNGVSNASATKSYFIPTKTASEWASFRNNAGSHPDITVNPCCAKVC